MCTAVCWNAGDHYFGRNLDLEYGYNESVTVTPRNYPFLFRMTAQQAHHYALIGMATVVDDYPLYYEATNEKGLSMAGLNFTENAVYLPPQAGQVNIAPFEFIPWLLGQCTDVVSAKQALKDLNLTNTPFSTSLPLSPLHWLIADRTSSIVVEPMTDGLQIHDNPVGILTNNPPFDFHLHNLGLYRNVSAKTQESRFSDFCPLPPWSNGMGGLGLPGDFSSSSRFIKATFVKFNSLAGNIETDRVSQFFHILSSVAMPRGSVIVGDQQPEITRYSCCCNTDKGIYYYQTYDNCHIHGIDLHREDLDGATAVSYPLITHEPIPIQN